MDGLGSPSRPSTPDDAIKLFEKLDRHKTGKVSQLDMLKALRKDRAVAGTLGLPSVIHQEDGSRGAFERLFQSIDTDNDKYVTRADIFRAVRDSVVKSPAKTPHQKPRLAPDHAREDPDERGYRGRFRGRVGRKRRRFLRLASEQLDQISEDKRLGTVVSAADYSLLRPSHPGRRGRLLVDSPLRARQRRRSGKRPLPAFLPAGLDEPSRLHGDREAAEAPAKNGRRVAHRKEIAVRLRVFGGSASCTSTGSASFTTKRWMSGRTARHSFAWRAQTTSRRQTPRFATSTTTPPRGAGCRGSGPSDDFLTLFVSLFPFSFSRLLLVVTFRWGSWVLDAYAP